VSGAGARSSVTGILLAAGRGTRFDPSGARNKLLQPLGNSTVVATSAVNLLAALPRVVAVVKPGDAETASALRGLGCEIVICEQAACGMAASLVTGLHHAQDALGWVVALGDMPHVRPGTISALAREVEEGADIAVPMYDGQRGNPVAFGRRHLPLLLALEGDQGARSIVKNYPNKEVMVNDPGIMQDIDTPSDLK
jgi:molybdenum cofactor cytidylyltransferase